MGDPAIKGQGAIRGGFLFLFLTTLNIFCLFLVNFKLKLYCITADSLLFILHDMKVVPTFLDIYNVRITILYYE